VYRSRRARLRQLCSEYCSWTSIDHESYRDCMTLCLAKGTVEQLEKLLREFVEGKRSR